MSGQYGGLSRNLSASGLSQSDLAGGDRSGSAASSSSSAAAAAVMAANNDSVVASSSSERPAKSGMRARLIVADKPETREKVHRIRATATADGDVVDLRRDRSLCILGCCGRGRVIVVWSTRDPRDPINSAPSGQKGTNGVGNAYGSLYRESSTDGSRNGNVNSLGGNSASTVASVTGGGTSLGQWTGPEHAITSDEPLDSAAPGSEKLGRLQFNISYDFEEQTLTLRIIRAVDLAAKDFGGTSDPYVKIMLLPDKKRKLQTNIKRKNLNPRWNEVFAFEGFPYNKLMNKTLYMQVLDYDRFSRDDPIGEVCIPLSDFDLVNGQTLWKNLQPCKGHAGKLGELYISLCYQPASSQITVTVHKARQLKAKDINGLSDPYVKIWLIHDGKKVEKKKTETKERTLDPIFNDSFDFNVPYERIRQTSLVVTVMDYDRMGRNEQIGQIVLGAKSGPMEVKHWNEMFAKTRQPVSQWHILKDFS